MDLYEQAMTVAETYDVSTPKDSVVLYSISFLPSKKNRDLAFSFIKNNPDKRMIEDTDCGAELVKMGVWTPEDCGLSPERVASIWKVASSRFIKAASGNVTAFVEQADPRSVFCSMELPELLKNSAVKTINGEDKHRFAECFCKNKTS